MEIINLNNKAVNYMEERNTDKYQKHGITIGPGWERERRVHFDEIVLNYDKRRWDYPEDLFKDALEYSGTGTGKKAIEIGAGTGKATKPFLDAGFDVTAVELGKNMSEFISEKYKDRKNFNVITSTFEDVVLEDDSYDIIYAASAFHWVESEIGCPKVYRLLKTGGIFALFRSSKVIAANTNLYEEIQDAYKKYHPDPYKRPEDKENLWTPKEILRGYGFENMADYGFTDIYMKLYEKDLSYTADEYLEFLDTMSDHRILSPEDKDALYNAIKNAINNHGGQIINTNIFQLYMGKKGIKL